MYAIHVAYLKREKIEYELEQKQRIKVLTKKI